MSEPKIETTNPWDSATEQRGYDLAQLRDVVAAALTRRLDVSDVKVGELRRPVGAGTSSETVLFTATWTESGERRQRDLVMRTHPDRFQLFIEPGFERQFRVIDALHRAKLVKVAEALFYEDDPSWIGVPFFVMSQFAGRVPVTRPPYNSAGFLFDATLAERRVAWETAVEELCRIATVPLETVGFLDQPEYGPTGLEQQLDYWRRSIDWSMGGETPDVVWQLYEWLAANLPDDRPDGFAWGDARIGNMIFGDEFRLVGVMDWEQANIGGTRQDLAWWLYFDDFHADGMGLKRLDGLGTRQETIAIWEDRVGETAGDLTWHEVFTGFKVTLLGVRTMTLVGAPDARAVESNSNFTRACEQAGL